MLWRLALLILAASLSAETLPFDLAGRPVNPFAAPGAKAVVFIFVRTDCPISNRYAPEIRRLDAKFSPRGVAFWLVYPDPNEPVEAIRRHIHDYGYPATALRDPEHSLVKQAEVQVTPEAAVFAPNGNLLYHGRIDDRYVDFGKARPAPTTHDLELALGAVLAGKPAPNKATRAVGCFLSDLR
ncbi:MAG: hypothetical protein DMG59_25260 [Acidobacteria bacterium]|jgi:hypothetical protein|nr:MAG: hypothetical protein DMG59_25260 [Acidobacteriota bacterium]